MSNQSAYTHKQDRTSGFSHTVGKVCVLAINQQRCTLVCFCDVCVCESVSQSVSQLVSQSVSQTVSHSVS